MENCENVHFRLQGDVFKGLILSHQLKKDSISNYIKREKAANPLSGEAETREPFG